MAVGYIKRVAGPFTGAGTVSLPFGFVVYKETDIYVALASSESATHTLEYGTDYTVTLNDDQETTPGGTVTLTTPLVDGEVVAVGSALEYNQPTQLTNFSRFPPEIINEALDRIVILIQQLVEKSSRAITTDITDTMSAGELKAKLLSSAEDAAKSAASAAGSASAAAASAKAAEDSKTKLEGDLAKKEAELEESLTAHGEAEKAKVTAEGDKQVARIQLDVGNILVENATGCVEKVWTLTEDIASGTTITIPGTAVYIVGRHHLRVSYNGLVCAIDQNFAEIGNEDTKSKQFKLLFDAKAGDEIDVWVAALGKADVADAIETAETAQSAVAELSQKVVYKDTQSLSS